jgi:hypothetical protein
MSRMYSFLQDAVAYTTAKDMMRITAPATKSIVVHHVEVTQDLIEVSEMLPIQIQQSSNAGTGGSAITPKPLDPGDAAFGGTAVVNLSGDTAISGAPYHRRAEDVRVGWIWTPTPELRPVIPGGGFFVVRLETAPSVSMTFNVVVYAESFG